MEHHVRLILNRAAAAKQTRTLVAGRLHSLWQVSISLNPQIVAGAPKASQADAVLPHSNGIKHQVGGNDTKSSIPAHALQVHSKFVGRTRP